MQLLLGFGALVGALVVALILTVGGVRLMRREARKRGGSGSLGSALQELESLFVESKTHVILAERDDHSEEESSGDPPSK